MRVAFQTHGCRLNQFESDAMVGAVRAAGHEVVGSSDLADVLVLNSCTITHHADADARKAIRRARRDNPAIRVVVTGCWASASPHRAAELEGVVLVLGNEGKADLGRWLAHELDCTNGRGPHVAVDRLRRSESFSVLEPVTDPDRTRALLKVQDGCDYRCSFCIVPEVRGRSRSLALEQVVAHARRLVTAGLPELVLTGIHLGTWGRDLAPRRKLSDLVAALLPVLGSARLRLSSIDPHEIDDELIDLLRDHGDRLCPHLHLPVQSCDDGVLRRMRRAHTVASFRHSVERLTAAVPRIGIGTDVIVGFPGEDQETFQRTRAVLASLPLAYLHVFGFSRRQGTLAATMADQVDPAAIRARVRELRRLSTSLRCELAKRCVDQSLAALILRHRDGRTGQLVAVTENGLEVRLDGPDDVRRRWVAVRPNEDGRHATLVT